MVQIVGKYQYVSAENFENFIKNLGNSEIVDVFKQCTPVIEVQQKGDQWVITINNQGVSYSSTFKLGEVFEEKLLSVSLKSVATREGNSFRIETPVSADVKMTRIYEFTADGMNVHLSSNKSDIKAKRTYKRL